LFSSITVIVGGILALQLGEKITNPQYAMLGGFGLGTLVVRSYSG